MLPVLINVPAPFTVTSLLPVMEPVNKKVELALSLITMEPKLKSIFFESVTVPPDVLLIVKLQGLQVDTMFLEIVSPATESIIVPVLISISDVPGLPPKSLLPPPARMSVAPLIVTPREGLVKFLKVPDAAALSCSVPLPDTPILVSLAVLMMSPVVMEMVPPLILKVPPTPKLLAEAILKAPFKVRELAALVVNNEPDDNEIGVETVSVPALASFIWLLLFTVIKLVLAMLANALISKVAPVLEMVLAVTVVEPVYVLVPVRDNVKVVTQPR